MIDGFQFGVNGPTNDITRHPAKALSLKCRRAFNVQLFNSDANVPVVEF